MLSDYFIISVRNLRRRKLRAWLTMLGIFIGIAAVVALISLGQGLQDYINTQFEQLGGDKILIQTKTLGPPGSTTNPALILTKDDLQVIKNIGGVENAVGVLVKTGPVKFRDGIEVVMVSGADEEYFELFGDIEALELAEGRQLKDGDKYKAVVGYNHVLGDLWDKKAKVGNKLEIEGRGFEIIGVLSKQGNPYDDNAVLIQKEVLADLLNIEDEESMIVAKSKKGFDTAKIAEEVKRKLRKERGEKEGEETFSVQTSEQLLETFSDIFTVVQGVLVGIAAISLLVGGIGIMNTMYTAVLERTKEIGTMKAIGAKNSDILLLFLFESGLLGLVGGLIGVGIGIGLAKSVEYIAGVYLGTPLLQASMNPVIMIGALAFGFVVGTASGVLPSMQASRLKPVDALRYE